MAENDKALELARAIKELNSEEAQYFLEKLECAIKKQKVQTTGYLVAIGVWVTAMIFGLAYFGTHDGFTGWVFLLPFALVGLVLWIFGKVATNIGKLADRPKE